MNLSGLHYCSITLPSLILYFNNAVLHRAMWHVMECDASPAGRHTVFALSPSSIERICSSLDTPEVQQTGGLGVRVGVCHCSLRKDHLMVAVTMSVVMSSFSHNTVDCNSTMFRPRRSSSRTRLLLLHVTKKTFVVEALYCCNLLCLCNAWHHYWQSKP